MDDRFGEEGGARQDVCITSEEKHPIHQWWHRKRKAAARGAEGGQQPFLLASAITPTTSVSWGAGAAVYYCTTVSFVISHMSRQVCDHRKYPSHSNKHIAVKAGSRCLYKSGRLRHFFVYPLRLLGYVTEVCVARELDNQQHSGACARTNYVRGWTDKNGSFFRPNPR